MKNLTRLSLSLVALAGLSTIALADDTKPDPTKAPAATVAKPPADIAAVAKQMAGTWRCTGTALGADGKEVPMKSTVKNKVELDGWWLSSAYAENAKNGFKMTAFTSFDDKTKKWTRHMFNNMGGTEMNETTGMKDNKMVWEGTSTSPRGSMKSRHTEESASPKQVHMTGEYTMDGKAWMKAYDMVCKK